MKRTVLTAIAVCTLQALASGADDFFSLAQAEDAVITRSARLGAVDNEWRAAEKRAEAARGQSGPRISIDGQYRWLAHVPELTLPLTGRSTLQLGDTHTYSFGATASWLMWDHGGRRDAYRSAQAAASAKKAEADAVRRRIVLAGRTAYYGVVLAREQSAILARAVELARSQYDDIALKARVGTKSRRDEISARQELLRRSRQLRQAQADEAQALRTLARATGDAIDAVHAPRLERIEDLLPRRRDAGAARLMANHPDVTALAELVSAARLVQSGFEAGLWPKVSLNARSSIEYPDQVQKEQYTQHTAAVSAGWTIYEGGQSRAQASASSLSAAAAQRRVDDARADVQAAWASAQDQRAALEDQKKIDEEIVGQSEELARIVFAAYTAGTVEYLQVEDANVKALESVLTLARTNTQLLVNDAVLASMAEE